MSRPLTFGKLARQSLRHYWRADLSVVAGTAVSAAVLVGALLVGESVRESLRDFALLRLGKTDVAMNSGNRFFSESLPVALGQELGLHAVPVLRLDGIAANLEVGDNRVQVNRAQVLGIDESFWSMSTGQGIILGEGEVALSRNLATALGVETGDEISLRVKQPALMPRDAPLSSRKDSLSRSGAMVVKAIVEDADLGRFGLEANQVAPYNVFVGRGWLQELVGMESKVNLVLLGAEGEELDASTVQNALKRIWHPSHVGIAVRSPEGIGIFQLETDRVFLDPATSRAAMGVDDKSVEGAPAGVLAYLVTSIKNQAPAAGKASTPYSFMLACSPSADEETSLVPAEMTDSEIIISQWLSEQVSAKEGSALSVEYLSLLPSGEFAEESREFTVRAVIPMERLAVERKLMPDFPGLTDADSCRDWSIGMPVDEEMLTDKANEAYWKEYGPTPKAVVTLQAGQEMWSNRFGNLSAVRYKSAAGAEESIMSAVAETVDPAAIGLFFVPARQQALDAVSQAMDFGGLFLGMSFFLIVAALMLTGLLFVFGIEQRATQMGTLLSVGYRTYHLRCLFLLEGALIGALGAALGAVAGSQYTRFLTWGLGAYWQGAVANAAITFHWSLAGVLYGAVAAFAIAVIAMLTAMWRQTRHSSRELLEEDFSQLEYAGDRLQGRRWIGVFLSIVGIVGAVITIGVVTATGAHNTVPAFFTAGSLLLLGGMGTCSALLSRIAGAVANHRLTIAGMGIRNAARRRGRSLAVIGLLACGSFMIFAVSSTQENIRKHAHERSSGTGGFDLFGESTFPLLLPLGDDKTLRGMDSVSLKLREGDDASCFNLNHAQAPELLGVNPDDFISRQAFAREEEVAELWNLLKKELPDGQIPGLVGDSGTAMWGLKMKADEEDGGVIVFRDERGDEFGIKLVGKLPMKLSVFQGSVLISAEDFMERYPSDEGYRVFLVDPADDANLEAVGRELEKKLRKTGVEFEESAGRMEAFYSVELTYLRMFLVLGGLGLLLGSVGMGIVVLRNVMERRGELAVLICMGLSRRQIRLMVVVEHATLLVLGLVTGVISSAIAIWPNLSTPGVEIPYLTIASLLAGMLLFSLAWIDLSTRLALSGPLLSSLRSE
ncbi:MAG: FtsX-like permease family protein [Kiritimatiellia bacterium]|jgi:ABC-type lipoprotein release transport system permease subunit|nr:FtsX-like permease family protein [Kiritimatiellia bacterium]MDP6847572.1 FtsX-like permease family protein [Kiritimatiellia bacterium]